MTRFVNNTKTLVLLAVMGSFFVLVGGLTGGSQGATFGLVLGVVFSFGSYWFSDKIALASARARPVTREEALWLYQMVGDLTERAGMPMPQLYVTPEAQPNAFATGRSERHAAVAVTQGILDVLSEDELRGVLAHELSHVRNHDILIGSIAAAMAMGITFVARMLMFGAWGGRNRRQNVVGMLAMAILAPLAATLIRLALSRSRESEADRSGAELLGDGVPLARALQKLDDSAHAIPMGVDPAQASAYIVNPLFGHHLSVASIFSTHPPTERRIQALLANQHQYR
jgi:heat shock protein HtpX